MSNVRVDANAVLMAAGEKKLQIKLDLEAARARWFNRHLFEPVEEGHLWWRRTRYRTQAECEALYVRISEGFWDSPKYGVENRYIRRVEKLEALIALANASGDGFVTLGVDDVRLLGLGDA